MPRYFGQRRGGLSWASVVVNVCRDSPCDLPERWPKYLTNNLPNKKAASNCATKVH